MIDELSSVLVRDVYDIHLEYNIIGSNTPGVVSRCLVDLDSNVLWSGNAFYQGCFPKCYSCYPEKITRPKPPYYSINLETWDKFWSLLIKNGVNSSLKEREKKSDYTWYKEKDRFSHLFIFSESISEKVKLPIQQVFLKEFDELKII